MVPFHFLPVMLDLLYEICPSLSKLYVCLLPSNIFCCITRSRPVLGQTGRPLWLYWANGFDGMDLKRGLKYFDQQGAWLRFTNRIAMHV